MRPPLNAGENAQEQAEGCEGPAGFNEAPAERGGKPASLIVHVLDLDLASMRPPLNAGENSREAVKGASTAPGFNEAPAERGGKLCSGSG